MTPTFPQLKKGMELQVIKATKPIMFRQMQLGIGDILIVTEVDRYTRQVKVFNKNKNEVDTTFWQYLKPIIDLVNAENYDLGKKPTNVSNIHVDKGNLKFTIDTNDFIMSFDDEMKVWNFDGEATIEATFRFKNLTGRGKVSTKAMNILKQDEIFIRFLTEKLNFFVDNVYGEIDFNKIKSGKARFATGDNLKVWFIGTLQFVNTITEENTPEKLKFDFSLLIEEFCKNKCTTTHAQKIEDKMRSI